MLKAHLIACVFSLLQSGFDNEY